VVPPAPAWVERATLDAWVKDALLPAALKQWHNPSASADVNPASFVRGGPSADCGVTPKIVVVGRRAPWRRRDERQGSLQGGSERVLCALGGAQVLPRTRPARRGRGGYAIGKADPMRYVEIFGTGDPAEGEAGPHV
jgi:hypothetical protein